MYKICFIGVGNMGGAMLSGIISSELVSQDNIIGVTSNDVSLKAVKAKYGINVSLNVKDAVSKSEIIILAVKPYMVSKILDDIKEVLSEKQILISVAAGVTMDDIEKIIGRNKKIIRTMPNTPAMVGEAMSAICINSNIDELDLKCTYDIFNSFGKSKLIEEGLIDSFIGVAGSSPAYVFMFIEAMADAAVLTGMPRKDAYVFAAQSVYGASKMVLETKLHPGELKDMVCSPGGTTIKAVEVLEAKGFRSSVIEGQRACVNKAIEMSKSNKQ